MKYLRSCMQGVGVWAIAFPLFWLISFAVVSLIYPALLEWFPDAVPEYNFVNQRDDYERFYALLYLLCGALTVFAVSYITVRADNERMEYMITETEGMYTVREGAGIYFSRYFSADVISALVIPLPLLIIDAFVMPLLGFLPDGVLSLTDMLFEPSRAFTSVLGILPSYAVLAPLFLVSRCLAGLRAIDIWRSVWLSDIEFVG